jgi:hypothetical protein
VQLMLASMRHPIVKLFPFRGWGLDVIGGIDHASGTPFHSGCNRLIHEMDGGCTIEQYDT